MTYWTRSEQEKTSQDETFYDILSSVLLKPGFKIKYMQKNSTKYQQIEFYNI